MVFLIPQVAAKINRKLRSRALIEGGVVAECGDGAAFVVDCSAREGIPTDKIACRARRRAAQVPLDLQRGRRGEQQ
jgi:hypothetical protein